MTDQKRFISSKLVYRGKSLTQAFGIPGIPLQSGLYHPDDTLDIQPTDETGGHITGPAMQVKAASIGDPIADAPADWLDWPICDECGAPIDPDEIHWVHEEKCTQELLGVCFCNLKYHPGCCPDCKDADDNEVEA
jgi:hypothetical protein